MFYPAGASSRLVPALSTQIQAASFTVDPAEVRLFAEQEAGSDLIEVMPGYHVFVWPPARCRDLPVLRSYLDICQRAAADLDIDLRTGTPWPSLIQNDTL